MRTKYWIPLALILFACLSTGGASALSADEGKEAEPLHLIVFGEEHAFEFGTPYVKNGRTLVPIRDLLVSLGVPNNDDAIRYDHAAETVTAVKDGTTLQLTLGHPNVLMNGQLYAVLDVHPEKKDGRVYLPARAVAEAFGHRVYYDAHSNAVVINRPRELHQDQLNAELTDAVLQGDYAKALSLLCEGADPNATMLQMASSDFQGDDKERARMLKLLHAYEADLDLSDEYGNTVLGGLIRMYDVVLEDGQFVDRRLPQTITTAFQLGARTGVHTVLALDEEERLEVMALLLAAGFDINGTYAFDPAETSQTLLERAVYLEKEPIVIMQLIALGASPTEDRSLAMARQLTAVEEREQYGSQIVAVLENYSELRKGLSLETATAPEAKPFVWIDRDLYLIDQDGQYGFINAEGETVIAPQFAYAEDFYDGMALIEDEAGRAGYIDETGTVVVPPTYARGGRFSEGLAMVQDDDFNIHYMDKNGEIVISLDPGISTPFSGGLAAYSKMEHGVFQPIRFIDRSGKVVLQTDIPFHAFYQVSFFEGFAAVRHDGEQYYIDQTGEAAFDSTFAYANDFMDGAASVAVIDQYGVERYGFIDTEGRFIIEPVFFNAGIFTEGLALASDLMGKRGYIDRQGRLVIPFMFENASFFSEGLAAVRSGDRWGYINRQGEWVIEPQFDYAEPFAGDLARFETNRTVGYVNRNGDIVWSVDR